MFQLLLEISLDSSANTERSDKLFPKFDEAGGYRNRNVTNGMNACGQMRSRVRTCSINLQQHPSFPFTTITFIFPRFPSRIRHNYGTFQQIPPRASDTRPVISMINNAIDAVGASSS